MTRLIPTDSSSSEDINNSFKKLRPKESLRNQIINLIQQSSSNSDTDNEEILLMGESTSSSNDSSS